MQSFWRRLISDPFVVRNKPLCWFHPSINFESELSNWTWAWGSLKTIYTNLMWLKLTRLDLEHIYWISKRFSQDRRILERSSETHKLHNKNSKRSAHVLVNVLILKITRVGCENKNSDLDKTDFNLRPSALLEPLVRLWCDPRSNIKRLTFCLVITYGNKNINNICIETTANGKRDFLSRFVLNRKLSQFHFNSIKARNEVRAPLSKIWHTSQLKISKEHLPMSLSSSHTCRRCYVIFVLIYF